MSDSNQGSFAEEQGSTVVSIKSLLEAGAHFGHQTERWCPKMLPYIYAARNDVHVINLDITLKLWERAQKFITDVTSRGGNVLMVGTKLQARELVEQEAKRCGAYYVTSRWLGGMLSNFQTIKNSIDRMKKLEELLEQAQQENSKVKISKKERLSISRQLEKLNANLGGIRAMRKPPELVFIVDIIKEEIAVAESRRLHIPVVAMVDTNADPNEVDFPIPSNDDAARAIKLFASGVADAILEGRRIFDARKNKQDRDAANSGHKNGAANGAPVEEGVLGVGGMTA